MSSKKFEVLYPNEVSKKLYETNDRDAFFQSDYFRDYFTEKIDLIKKSGLDPVVSCDIFDTVLLRNDKSEPYRFYEIAESIKNALGLENSVYEVLLARYLGTEISYAASNIVQGCREGSLLEIHRVLLNALDIDPKMLDESVQAELEYEKNNLSLNEGLWNLLKELKDAGDIEIVFISDTYKHGEHIDDLIVHFLPEYTEYVKTLYSSADITISKHSSHIFDYVRKDTGYDPKQFLHIGDNLHSDYRNAKKKGWSAMFLPIPKYQQEEIRKNLIEFKKQLDRDNITIKLIDRLFAGK